MSYKQNFNIFSLTLYILQHDHLDIMVLELALESHYKQHN